MSSLSSNLSKLEKEKQKLIQEKCQALLNEMLRDEDNKYCVDCDAKGPRWASWNLGIFLCIRCAGIHRNLGVHISRVKSVNLDTWTPEQVVTMQQMGNSRGRAVYEANLPDTFRRPQTDSTLEQFIRAKYEHSKYIAKEWVKPSPVPKVNWDTEIEESIKRKKEGKKVHHGSTGDIIGPLPAPAVSKTQTSSASRSPGPVGKKLPVPSLDSNSNSTPSVPTPAPAPVTAPPSSSDDLLGLTLGVVDTQLPTTPANLTNNQDDLGSLFLTPVGQGSELLGLGSSASGQKMTKESILSLYGSGSTSAGTTPVGLGAGGVPNINPFLNPYPQQQQPGFFGGTATATGSPMPNIYQNPLGQFSTPQPTIPPGGAGLGIPDFMFGNFQQSQAQAQPIINDPLQNQFLGLNLGNISTPQGTNQFGGNINMVPNGHAHPGILGLGQLPPQQPNGLGNLMGGIGMNMNMGMGLGASSGFNKMGGGASNNLPGLGTSVNQLQLLTTIKPIIPNGTTPTPQPTVGAGANLSLGDIWK